MILHNTDTGDPLLCCWEDCEQFGNTDYQVVVRKNRSDRGLTYLFCGSFHRDLFANSHRDNGNVG